MREFTRIILRMFMCLFLAVGCVNNIYYFAHISSNNDYATYNRHKARYYDTYDENGYNEYQQTKEVCSDTITVDLTENRSTYYP
jgi:hypothetical protein